MAASLKRVVIARIMRVLVMVLELVARMLGVREQRLGQLPQQLDLVERVLMQGAGLGQQEGPIWMLRWELLREELLRIVIRRKVLLGGPRTMIMPAEVRVRHPRVEAQIVLPQIRIVHQQQVGAMMLTPMHLPRREEVRRHQMV
jgi:hypothetical protein